MTFKIVQAEGATDPDFDGTREAGAFLRNNINYHDDNGHGPSGEDFLRDLWTNVLNRYHKVMVDANDNNCFDQHGNPVVGLKIKKESGAMHRMALPPGNAIDTDYLERTLRLLKTKFDAHVDPSDPGLKDFLLGIILLSKCR